LALKYSDLSFQRFQEKISLTSYGQPIMRIYERTAEGEHP
jgi:hypothetical protein